MPFDGICLTDTFQLYESGQMELEGTFPENNKRVKRQKESPIRVVIANPPYSANQGDANNNNQNLEYPALDQRISETYVARSSATLKNSLYDSYVRAIRWASDRIKDKGVVGFVTNGYFIDGNAMDGLRACLMDEFQSVHVFNLRGNQRTSGEVSRQEGGKIFGSGARTPVAITLLVKNPAKKSKCVLRYHDIGDYLSREEKLAIIKGFSSVSGIEKAKQWMTLAPNDDFDWINQRDPAFEKFSPIGNKDGIAETCIFEDYSLGVSTSRDSWMYSFSKRSVTTNVKKMVENFNSEVSRFHAINADKSRKELEEVADELLDNDPKKIAWSVNLKRDAVRNVKHKVSPNTLRIALYRPFCKQFLVYDRSFIERPGQTARLFPSNLPNVAICATSIGNRSDFSVVACNLLPDIHMSDKSGASQCFPLYLYEPAEESGKLGFDKNDGEIIDGYRRRDAITDGILNTFREAYGKGVSKEDIFYYVYGVLHSPEYRTRFAADLKKMLPRIPLTKETKDFRAFSDAGRKLAEWHLNYETVEPWNVVEHADRLDFDKWEQFHVTKMTFARPTAEQKAAGLKWDKTRIVYNSHVTITHIPLEAYEYVVNGKPAIEWVMERYQVTRDKDSGIVNDPNDWCKEHDQPRYIIDLIGRVVRVSIETMKIVKSLPPLNERKSREDGA